MRSIDIAVIGGGLAGLSAAAYLARAGRKVALFDKGSDVGGRATSERKEGAWCNLGPHALYESGAASEVLRELGIPFSGKGPSPLQVQLRLNGKNESLWSFFFRKLNGPGKKEFISFFLSMNKVDTHSLRGISAMEWVQSRFRQPLVRSFILSMVRLSTYNANPDLLRADAAIRQVQLANRGVMYVDGGWQTLVSGLKQRVLEWGGSIETGSKVEELLCESGRVKAMRLAQGTHIDISAAIVASGPREASQLIKRNQALPTLSAWAEQLIPVHASCLDLVLRRMPNPKISFTLGVDEPIYFSNHSAAAQLSDNGNSIVHLLKYQTSGVSTDAMEDRAQLEKLMDSLQPGWRKEVVFSRFLPHMAVCHGFPQVKGLTMQQPQSTVPEMKGLFVAGDWIHTKGLLADAAAGSGKQAAGMALAYLLETSDHSGVEHDGNRRAVSHL